MFATLVDLAYLELTLTEKDLQSGSSSDIYKQKMKASMEYPEWSLPMLQQPVQNMLLHTHKSRENLFQAVDDSRWTPLLSDFYFTNLDILRNLFKTSDCPRAWSTLRSSTPTHR